MKKLKLSPWHSGDVKPIRKGIYQRNWFKYDSFYSSDAYYAYWDGENWNESSAYFEHALKFRTEPSLIQNLEWRGILK